MSSSAELMPEGFVVPKFTGEQQESGAKSDWRYITHKATERSHWKAHYHMRGTRSAIRAWAPLQGSMSLHTEVSELPDQTCDIFLSDDPFIGILTKTFASVWQEAGSSETRHAAATLDALIQEDAAVVWHAAVESLDEGEHVERLGLEFAAFIRRHGDAGVKALSSMILGRLPSTEPTWELLRLFGSCKDENTSESRRNVLAAALESRDAGIRYAAASALSEFPGEFATSSLKKRLVWEKNPSVRRMIEAELRR